MNLDPTETAHHVMLAVLDAVRHMVPSANGVAARAILDDLAEGGWAVVRADLPHGTVLDRWYYGGMLIYQPREVSS